MSTSHPGPDFDPVQPKYHAGGEPVPPSRSKPRYAQQQARPPQTVFVQPLKPLPPRRPPLRPLTWLLVLMVLSGAIFTAGLSLLVTKLTPAGLEPTTPTRKTTAPTTRTPRTPVSSPTPSTQPTPSSFHWLRHISTIHPGGKQVLTPDGSFDGHGIITAGGLWLILTENENGGGGQLHALDPATGQVKWQRPMDEGLCSYRLVSGHVACLSALAKHSSGLGTKWRVQLLDPATGTVGKQRDIAGWFTLIHVQHNRLILMEQRQPAPHAVVTVLNADLKQVGHIDLKRQPQHIAMFTENRMIMRHADRIVPKGPALDRKRIREVGRGLTALWAGGGTAFIDARTGSLKAMPPCSRVIDDGARIWCNDDAKAVAYDYQFRQLHHTELGVRLAFPRTEQHLSGVGTPAFLDLSGRLKNVDLATGKTRGTIAETRNESVFGMSLQPRVTPVGNYTLVVDSEGTRTFDRKTGRLLWVSPEKYTDNVWLVNNKLVFGSYEFIVVEPTTGRVLAKRVVGAGSYVIRVGEAWAVTGIGVMGSTTIPPS